MSQNVNRQLLALILCASTLGFWGCASETAAPPPEITIDTTACLGSLPNEGARAGNDSCRALLSRSFTAEAMSQAPSGCLLFSADGNTRVLDTMWIDDRIELFQGLDNLDLTVNTTLTAELFLFDSEQSAAQCSGLQADTSCQALQGCLLRLGPQLVDTAPGSDILIDFTAPDQSCVLERSQTQLYPPEACDGSDNDCDGTIDESITFDVRTCQESTTPNCQRSGLKTCIDGAVVCSVSELLDGCNGIDEDCDGLFDEDAECDMCSEDEPCSPNLHCSSGTCVECIDNSHCTNPLVCKNNLCQTCQDDGDCGDALICANTAAGPTCGRCDPQRSETCPGGQICDTSSLSCRGCNSDSECPNQVCIGGTCADCDPGPNPRRGCLRGEICADDRATGGTINCRVCNPNAPVEECPTNSYCVANTQPGSATCEVCRPNVAVSANGCRASQPICKLVNGALSCERCIDGSDECGDGATCTLGRCEGCALPSENGGGGGDSTCPMDQPICAPSDAGNRCKTCSSSEECRRTFGPGVRDTCLNDQTCVDCAGQGANQEGCDSSSDRPICRTGSCQGCSTDEDCRAIANGGPKVACDTRPNEPRKCVVCVPGTSDECGNQVCGPNFECTACDDPQNGYDCRDYFPGDREFCHDSGCAECSPDALPGSNGCDNSQPVCSGDPPRCRTCMQDSECGDLLCHVNECLACAPDTVVLEEGTDYTYAFNRGCARVTPICIGNRCERCQSTSDCPVGECFSGSCRVQTLVTCRSRGLLFNANTSRCFQCNTADDQCPNTNCRQVSQGLSLCGGCDDDTHCTNNMAPFCNVNIGTNDEPMPEVTGFALNMCRQCRAPDCDFAGSNKPFCLRSGLGCGICDVTSEGQSVNNPAEGCDDERPFCLDGDRCVECTTDSHCPANQTCSESTCN